MGLYFGPCQNSPSRGPNPALGSLFVASYDSRGYGGGRKRKQFPRNVKIMTSQICDVCCKKDPSAGGTMSRLCSPVGSGPNRRRVWQGVPSVTTVRPYVCQRSEASTTAKNVTDALYHCFCYHLWCSIDRSRKKYTISAEVPMAITSTQDVSKRALQL
jgi:hypothetical protein